MDAYNTTKVLIKAIFWLINPDPIIFSDIKVWTKIPDDHKYLAVIKRDFAIEGASQKSTQNFSSFISPATHIGAIWLTI